MPTYPQRVASAASYDARMRLYHFTKLETAEKYILRERRLKLSQFGKVNDPFELLCTDMGDKVTRHVLKKLRDHWHKRLGFISMSATSRSPVMWAHYSESHTGICLGFDIADDKPEQMIYEPRRLQVLLDPSKPTGGADAKLIKQILLTKYEDWNYEREWRVFSNLDKHDPETRLYYVDFGPQIELREVIVGINCPGTVGHLAKLIRDVGPVRKSVTVSKARAAFQTFEVVQQKLVNPIVIRPPKI